MSVDEVFPCIICNSLLRPGRQAWHAVCSNCKYEGSRLEAAINQADMHALIDEKIRLAGLKAIRDENFGVIARAAHEHAAPSATALLDVGCAHGWFLEQAQTYFQVLGLEPDIEVGQRAAGRGLPVRIGYFPAALKDDECFDVIVFNDVIEHILDIRAALAECHRRLNVNGLLILNLPSSAGLFYRLASFLARCGITGPFRRMWQFGLPSPHLHYFNPANLQSLVHSFDFKLLRTQALPVLRRAGLLSRLRTVGHHGTASLYGTYLAVCCLLPMLRFFPSDICLLIFKKAAAETSGTQA